MKKFYYAMAAALVMLSSCSSEEEPALAEASETTTVTISASLPDFATSRVYEDEPNIPGKGRQIKVVHYAVYNQYDEFVISDATANEDEKVNSDPDDHGHYTFTVQLLKQHTYTFYVWAEAENSPYTFNPSTKQVTVDYTKVKANDESCDAFFGKHQFTIADKQSALDQYTVILNRPFAQLNILTNDHKKIQQLEPNLEISSIDVEVTQNPGKYSKLNVVDFKASAPASKVVYHADFPNGWDDLVHAGDGDVAKYYYLATCYLLTGVNPDGSLNGLVGTEKEVTGLTITITYNDNTTVEINKENVPIRRSWRTNIWGNLQSADAEANCRIDFNFSGAFGDGPGADNGSYGADDGDHSGDDNSNNETID